MIVRRARYDDMNAILDLMQDYHPTSNMSSIPFVRHDAAKVLDYMIGNRSCLPLAAFDSEGVLNGILLVELNPYFFNKKHYFATETAFISNGAGMQLLAAFKKWFKTTDADQIIMAVSSGDPRADQFLELSGLEKTGSMYVLRR